MGGIKAKALYLASPLAFAACPAVAKPGELLAPTIPMSSTATAGSIATSTRAYIIVDVPKAADLGGGKSLNVAISEEVRRRMVERPDDRSETSQTLSATIRQTDFTVGDEEAGPDTIGDAVIAAHAERIAVLKQRMDALRAEGTAGHRFDELRIRLRRAEAARRLAIARVSVDKLPSSGCGIDRDVGCRSGAVAVALNRIVIHDAPAVTRKPITVPRKKPAVAKSAAAQSFAARARSRALLAVAGDRGEQRLHPIRAASGQKARVVDRAMAGTMSRSSATIPAAGPKIVSDDDVTLRLAQARRSLAAARDALRVKTDRPAPIAVAATAGLWQWPGSEKWSLADTRSRTA